MNVHKEFRFDAAHTLPKTPDGHKCKSLHGHSYKIVVHVKGNVNEENGWVIDFSEIKKIFQPILNILDHSFLNDIEGLENPTSENLAIWIWNKLLPHIPMISKIEISESPTSGCVYEGD